MRAVARSGVAMLVAASLLQLSGSAHAVASTLYVGPTNCSDAGTGTSPGNPFCTIGKAASLAVAGQTVVVSAGTYPENVTPKHSGTPIAPIVFAAAPGAAVIVTGKSHGFTISSQHDITVNGFITVATTSNGIYVKGSSNIQVTNNVVTSSGSRVSGSTAPGIYVGATTNSTVSGNTSHDNSDAGIYLTSGSTGILVANNMSYGNARGYTRAAPGIDVRSPGNQIIGNISHDNEDSGIQFYSGGDNNLAANNVLYHSKGWSSTLGLIGDHGIDDLGVRGNRIISNSVYDSVAAGINVEGLAASWLMSNIGATGTTVSVGTTTGFPASGNFTVQIDSEAMTVTSGQGTTTWTVARGVNGTVPAPHTAGSSTKKNILQFSGFVIANNISSDNAVNCPNGSGGTATCPRTKGDLRVDQTSYVGTVIDYDLIYLSVPGTWLTWQSTPYSSLSAFQTAVGQERHGVAGDPRWVDQASGNLRLRGSSSAIDSANSGLADEQSTDRDGNPRIDAPLTPNSGAGPRTYDDRGAYEYRPDNPPNAALSATPATGSAPLLVTADASASTDTDATPIASYQFDFGDGSPATGPQPAASASHTYPSGGTFTVTVTVTDTAANTATATATVTVSNAPDDAPPTAALSATPATGSAPLLVTADASASTDTDATPIASYQFDFGDGTVVGPQQQRTASHSYAAAGSYTVRVNVMDTAGQASWASASVEVKPPPTNLITNFGFETGTTGWNNNGRTGIALAQVTGGHSGSYAAQPTNTTTTTQADCTLNDSPNWVRSSQAGTYQASLWVRADTAGQPLTLRIREYSGSTFVSSASASITLSTDWQQVTVRYAPQVVGSSLDYTAYITKAKAGSCFTADDAWLSLS
jgi:parallel beta-helix repeat protein